MTDLVTAEIAAAYDEDRAALELSLASLAATFDDPDACGDLTVANLSPGALTISGNVEQCVVDHLRAEGFTVIATPEVALVKRAGSAAARKRRAAKVKDPASRALEALRDGKKISTLHVLNDEFSIRTARKIWHEYVEAEGYARFTQFLHDFDKLIMQARQREGHDDHTDDAQKSDSPAAFEDHRGGKNKNRAMAGLERDPNGLYNAAGQLVGQLSELEGETV